LLALPDGREIVAHCPEDYNRLQLDDLATGERLSGRETKSPDFFTRACHQPFGGLAAQCRLGSGTRLTVFAFTGLRMCSPVPKHWTTGTAGAKAFPRTTAR
jgi:hypothetical protein